MSFYDEKEICSTFNKFQSLIYKFYKLSCSLFILKQGATVNNCMLPFHTIFSPTATAPFKFSSPNGFKRNL